MKTTKHKQLNEMMTTIQRMKIEFNEEIKFLKRGQLKTEEKLRKSNKNLKENLYH